MLVGGGVVVVVVVMPEVYTFFSKEDIPSMKVKIPSSFFFARLFPSFEATEL